MKPRKGSRSKPAAKSRNIVIIESSGEIKLSGEVEVKTSLVDEIISELPLFNNDDLKKLYFEIGKILDKRSEIDNELFYMILNEIGEKPVKLANFEKSDLGKLWKENQPAFDKVISDITNGKTYRKTHILGLKRLLVSVLIEDLKESKIPLNIRNICHALGRFGRIFEASMPGYLRSGLGPLIMSRLVNN